MPVLWCYYCVDIVLLLCYCVICELLSLYYRAAVVLLCYYCVIIVLLFCYCDIFVLFACSYSVTFVFM